MENEQVQGKETLSLEEIKKFVAKNIMPVNGMRNTSRCVDGRYKKSDNLPPLAKPGADLGDVMIAVASARRMRVELNGNRNQIFDKIVDLVGGPDEFQFHTDLKHCDKGVGGGCGHFAQASGDPGAYGLDHSDIQIICSKLAELKERGTEEGILPGAHGEKAVVVINSPDLSLAPNDGENQIFVYQKALDGERRDRFAASLSSVIGVDKEKLLSVMTEVAKDHLEETLGRLAKTKSGESLPVYTVSGTVDNPVVQ